MQNLYEILAEKKIAEIPAEKSLELLTRHTLSNIADNFDHAL